jgi:endo-1,4-beta-xylanase
MVMESVLTRRKALALIGGAAIAGTTPASASPAAESLGEIAEKNGFVFGAAAGPAVGTNAGYRELYVKNATIITTDVAMKMGSIASQPDTLRFDAADRLLQFCDDTKIPMRGHCLIWNEWVPQWIKNLTVAERSKFFDSYIERVISRYRGRLHSWDVVNEPFWSGHKAPGGFRVGPWYDAFGPDYIRRAFERVAAVESSAKLVLNEAHCERDDEVGRSNRRGMLELVDRLKDADVRLDAVGLQGHLQPQYPRDNGRFAEFVDALGRRGVDIYITEFDVRDDTFPDDVAARDAAVAQTAQEFLAAVLPIRAVKALITWQLADNYSFYTADARRKAPQALRRPRPLPYDDTMQRKPLWFALARGFESASRA